MNKKLYFNHINKSIFKVTVYLEVLGFTCYRHLIKIGYVSNSSSYVAQIL